LELEQASNEALKSKSEFDMLSAECMSAERIRVTVSQSQIPALCSTVAAHNLECRRHSPQVISSQSIRALPQLPQEKLVNLQDAQTLEKPIIRRPQGVLSFVDKKSSGMLVNAEAEKQASENQQLKKRSSSQGPCLSLSCRAAPSRSTIRHLTPRPRVMSRGRGSETCCGSRRQVPARSVAASPSSSPSTATTSANGAPMMASPSPNLASRTTIGPPQRRGLFLTAAQSTGFVARTPQRGNDKTEVIQLPLMPQADHTPVPTRNRAGAIQRAPSRSPHTPLSRELTNLSGVHRGTIGACSHGLETHAHINRNWYAPPSSATGRNASIAVNMSNSLIGTELVTPPGSNVKSSPHEMSTSQHLSRNGCFSPRWRQGDTSELHTALVRQPLLPQRSSLIPSKLISGKTMVKPVRSPRFSQSMVDEAASIGTASAVSEVLCY